MPLGPESTDGVINSVKRGHDGRNALTRYKKKNGEADEISINNLFFIFKYI